MATAHIGAQRLQPASSFSSSSRKPALLARQLPAQHRAQQRGRPAAAFDALTAVHPVLAALNIDWSDPDVQVGALGAFAGLALGIGAPIFYVTRDERDEARLEELRALNRATKAETGEYLTPVRGVTTTE